MTTVEFAANVHDRLLTLRAIMENKDFLVITPDILGLIDDAAEVCWIYMDNGE
jgi:hypothetical protein